jgi:hypothetical protein
MPKHLMRYGVVYYVALVAIAALALQFGAR